MHADIHLDANEARVLAVLIEKQISTPEQYPLSLNALLNGCNQKSNRDPVTQWSETALHDVLATLIKKHWVAEKSGFSSRVSKYAQRFCNTEFGPLKFTAAELAVICELMLRGPQTPGELRTRTARLHAFTELEQVDETLNTLMHRADGPFIVQLPREAGKREQRYAHLFCGEVTVMPAAPVLVGQVETGADVQTCLADMQARLQQLENEVTELKAQLAPLLS